MSSAYVLKPHIRQRLRNRGVTFNCERCGKPIKLGEEVVSKWTRTRSPARIYHKKCFEEMYR